MKIAQSPKSKVQSWDQPFKVKMAAVLMVATLLGGSLTGCAKGGASSAQPLNTATPSQSASAAKALTVEYLKEDLDASWDASTAVKVSLADSSITVNGPGATAKGSVLTITTAGTYLLSGTLNNGQVIVNAGKKDIVRLILNGAQITCSNSAPIDVQQAGKIILTLADGTTNTITDGSSYRQSDPSSHEPNAAVFSKDALTINGTGSLVVKGNYKNGIGSTDGLVITGGQIQVTAANDGLRGRDSVAIMGGSLTINAKADGIQANNDQDKAKGWISLDGGTFNITAGNDAIQAVTTLQITDGTFSLVTGGGSANSSTDSSGNARPGWSQWSPSPSATKSTDTASAKALKAGDGILITGGQFTIDSSDDALHANGDVTVQGGTFAISSGDDGIHADANLTVDNGTIEIAKSYEGIEGMSITVNGGTIRLTSRDDGLNAAGGNDGSSQGGRPGQNSFSSTGNVFIRITGGNMTVNADGDGLDANGALYIDGGTILVNGPTANDNGALDYDSDGQITGGTLVAAGSAGMPMAPQSSSTQNSLMVIYSSIQKAGTLVNLAGADGTNLVTFAPSKDYQSIVISTPALKQGETYTLSSCGSSSGQNSNGLYTGGTYSSGTKVTSVTLSAATTSISDTGAAVSSGMGPGRMGGPGGVGAPPRGTGTPPSGPAGQGTKPGTGSKGN